MGRLVRGRTRERREVREEGGEGGVRVESRLLWFQGRVLHPTAPTCALKSPA
jgi:hypothetical protein